MAQPQAPKPARGAPELGISWTAPDGWVKAPGGSAMRAATYRVPRVGPDADDAEVTVFYFGAGQGGDVTANLARWAGQFGKKLEDGKTTEKQVGALGLSILDVEGTFSSGMPMGPQTPKTDYAMVGAVVKTKSTGNYFFKLTGPKRTVAQARPAFLQLLEGITEKAPQ